MSQRLFEYQQLRLFESMKSKIHHNIPCLNYSFRFKPVSTNAQSIDAALDRRYLELF
jgi:hypothetical protein